MSSVVWTDYDAVLFDLDGVITATARVHAAAWKAAFDGFLDAVGGDHARFDPDRDYRLHVDGRPRYDGVAAFLRSRGIELPWGDPEDPPGHDTVCALGNLKNEAFNRVLADQGADVFDGTIAVLDHLDRVGIPYAVVSASANAGAILDSVGQRSRFQAQVDGVVAAELGLAGKPEPDPFLEGARRLGVSPDRAVVVEDAVSGVEAGRAGGFALVIGVDRHRDPAALRLAGADLVVDDLGELADGGWPDFGLGDDPWSIERVGLPERPDLDETLFALGNGSLGLRGSFAQGAPRHEPGAFLNGFHETWQIEYPEAAFGFATLGQTIVRLPDPMRLAVVWNERTLDLADAQVIRTLDMRSGIVTTRATWPELTATWRTIVSIRNADTVAMDLTITAAIPGRVAVTHEIGDFQTAPDATAGHADPRRAPRMERVLVSEASRVDGAVVGLGYRTMRSRLPVTVVSRIEGSLDPGEWTIGDGSAAMRLTGEARPGESHRVELAVAYRRDELPDGTLPAPGSFAELAAAQIEEFARLWSASDVVIDGDPVAQRAVRFAIFQLHQASASLDGTGIPAKGVTGQAYEGHHFWDADVFVEPFLTATHPEAAETVIRWRHGHLPEARRRAEDLSVAGALYPWRTITGEEASAFFEAGTAQYHVAADVVYGLRNHVAFTGDDELLFGAGIEIAVEVARMYADLGFWDDTGFHIHGVTGPDEYTALVNDNAYTNQMARMVLRFAASAIGRLAAEQPDRHTRLVEELGLTPSEVAEWGRIADAMTVVVDRDLGVTAQDATFMSLEPWDWTIPADMHPLLLHFHPLVIYRHRMLKQADVVMAHFLLPEDTPLERRRADFDYYDPLTTGDSSLSPAVQSAVAARLGRSATAWKHFVHAASVDLADAAGNTADGVHLAAAAGVWLAVVRGFAGVELGTDGEVTTDPQLPASWRSLTIRMLVRGEPVEISLGGA